MVVLFRPIIKYFLNNKAESSSLPFFFLTYGQVASFAINKNEGGLVSYEHCGFNELPNSVCSLINFKSPVFSTTVWCGLLQNFSILSFLRSFFLPCKQSYLIHLVHWLITRVIFLRHILDQINA